MDKVDLGYMAGFFDGEGCITIGKNGAIDARITNTNKTVLDKFQSHFGGNIGDRVQKTNKRQYAYCLYGENAIKFLETIRPYLIEKKKQADSVIEYYALRNELQPITKPGQRGRFANPDRDLLVEVFRDILTELKFEEN